MMYPFGEVDLQYKDYPIGGKLITASIRVDEEMMINKFSDDASRQAMRLTLISKISEMILDHKLCEITTYKNPIDYTNTIVARVYVAPNGDIKILRTIGK